MNVQATSVQLRTQCIYNTRDTPGISTSNLNVMTMSGIGARVVSLQTTAASTQRLTIPTAAVTVQLLPWPSWPSTHITACNYSRALSVTAYSIKTRGTRADCPDDRYQHGCHQHSSIGGHNVNRYRKAIHTLCSRRRCWYGMASYTMLHDTT